jgi:protein involved in polysaccharide export with SLBB domain
MPIICQIHRKILFISLLLFTSLSLAQVPQDAEEEYRIQPGDTLEITVFNEPDLKVQQELDPNGLLNVPLLGRTLLMDYTLSEAESFLEAAFIEQEYLIKPQITVSVIQHAQQVFYIFGEVNNPGAKALPAGKRTIDILEAITLAGDLGQYAKRSEIILRRPIPGKNDEEQIVINLDEMIRGKNRGRSELIQILPQDIIFVPERIF